MMLTVVRYPNQTRLVVLENQIWPCKTPHVGSRLWLAWIDVFVATSFPLPEKKILEKKINDLKFYILFFKTRKSHIKKKITDWTDKYNHDNKRFFASFGLAFLQRRCQFLIELRIWISFRYLTPSPQR